MTSEPSTPQAEILFVCTGNVARSPYLEHRLRLFLAADGVQDFTVASAGVRALVGHAIAAPISKSLETSSISTDDAQAQLLTAPMLARADIVITAERAHIPEVTRLLPAVVHRTFTARQLARLLSADPSASERGSSAKDAVRLVIESAQRARGIAGRQSDDDDIPDPWQRSARVYRRSLTTMDHAIQVIADRITLASPLHRR